MSSNFPDMHPNTPRSWPVIPALIAPANSLSRAPLTAGWGMLCHATEAGCASQEGGDPRYGLSEQLELGSRLFLQTASRRGWILMWFNRKAGRRSAGVLMHAAFRKMSSRGCEPPRLLWTSMFDWDGMVLIQGRAFPLIFKGFEFVTPPKSQPLARAS